MTHVRDKDRLEARVRNVVQRMVRTLDLGWLEVQVKFDEGNIQDAMCASQCQWQYRRIVMNWNLQQVAHILDDELRLVAVHELCHALIDPASSVMTEEQFKEHKDRDELAAENVARVIMHLLKP